MPNNAVLTKTIPVEEILGKVGYTWVSETKKDGSAIGATYSISNTLIHLKCSCKKYPDDIHELCPFHGSEYSPALQEAKKIASILNV